MNDICQFITQMAKKQLKTHEEFLNAQRKFAKKSGKSFFKKDELLAVYKFLLSQRKIRRNKLLERLLILKSVRSLSGIVVVSLLTKPYACPGECLYCPTEKGAPKSYLVNEPAVARAVMCNYDPYLQVQSRLTALKNIGHPTDKINIRIIGGTWSYYPRQYQTWFIKEIYRAVNNFPKATNKTRRPSQNICNLEKVQINNEKSKNRIVEISIETRPDYIDKKEIKRLRNFGVTKVEIGAQALDDEILKKNRRGHDIAATTKATRLLKDAGFKIAYQMMANLPGSNLAKDKKIFKELFENSNFRPDYLKIYPLALVKNSGVYNLYQRKKFKPYSKQQLLNLIKYIKSIVPYYLRIERIIRDIPTADIVEGGAKISNLRQIVQAEMKKEESECHCIRCREIKDNDYTKFKPYLNVREYEASKGKEFFLSFETKRRDKLFSMLRLRMPSETILPELKNAAIIREVHTYGQQLGISKNEKLASQHKGLGKKLIREAERIAKKNGYKKIVVISGIGARSYFRKLGYKLQNTYMIKNLC